MNFKARKSMIQCIYRTLQVLLLAGFLVFAFEKADAQTTQDTYVSGVTSGRAMSIVTGLLGLVSLTISWRAKARSAKKGAKIALGLGLVVVALSIIHLVTTAGAVFGSGSGKAGAIVALLLGVVSIILSVITLRSSSV
jgi:peptidoglycan/LPS O-acetylase OafA/YrhL